MQKIYELIDLEGVQVIVDDAIDTFEVGLDYIKINPNFEMNDTVSQFILKNLNAKDWNEYFKKAISGQWIRAVIALVDQEFKQGDKMFYVNVLNRLIKNDCPFSVAHELYNPANTNNLILEKKIVKIQTIFGVIDGLWDEELGSYVPTTTATERAQVNRIYDEHIQSDWMQLIRDQIDKAVLHEEYRAAETEIGVSMCARNNIMLAHPLFVNFTSRIVALLIPKFVVTNRYVKVRYGVLSNVPWYLPHETPTVKDIQSMGIRSALQVQVAGIMRNLNDCTKTRKKQIRLGQLSDEEIAEEIERLISGTTDNPALKHLDVIPLNNDVYYLYNGNKHVFLQRTDQGFRLIGGRTYDNTLFLTEDEELIGEMRRACLLYDLL